MKPTKPKSIAQRLAEAKKEAEAFGVKLQGGGGTVAPEPEPQDTGLLVPEVDPKNPEKNKLQPKTKGDGGEAYAKKIAKAMGGEVLTNGKIYKVCAPKKAWGEFKKVLPESKFRDEATAAGANILAVHNEGECDICVYVTDANAMDISKDEGDKK